MTGLISDGDDPPSRDEVRRFESRIDARFQAVNARFTTMDRRFTSMATRIDDLAGHSRSLGERMDAHQRAASERLDGIDARVDLMQDKVVMQLDRTRRETLRTLVVVMIAVPVVGWVVMLGLVLRLA